MFEELMEIFKTKVQNLDAQKAESTAMLEFIEHIKTSLETKQDESKLLEIIGKLADRVDHLSKEVSDLQSQMKTRRDFVVDLPDNTTESISALDQHARTLIEIMAERPGRYTTNELVDMLGMNKTTVINVMKRALTMDPVHLRMSQGKRRKLYISFTPDAKKFEPSSPMHKYGTDTDHQKLELMSMT